MGSAMNGARAVEQVRPHRFDALLMHCRRLEKPRCEGRVDEARENGSSEPFVGSSAR